jgi:ADP-heptose:LPS heptosyltransferase
MMLLARVAGGSVGERYDLRLYVGDEDRRWAEQTLGGGGGRMVLLAPTTRWPAKQWPPDRFAALAEALLRDGGAAGVDRVVYVGAAGEREQCRALEALASREPRVVSLLGRTNVGQLMAVIERAAVVVAGDSAALHMAVGLGRPMVGLFGPTRVDLVGPYGHEHDVIQHVQPGEAMDHKRPEIGARQMARITMDEVLAAVKHRW